MCTFLGDNSSNCKFSYPLVEKKIPIKVDDDNIFSISFMVSGIGTEFGVGISNKSIYNELQS